MLAALSHTGRHPADMSLHRPAARQAIPTCDMLIAAHVTVTALISLLARLIAKRLRWCKSGLNVSTASCTRPAVRYKRTGRKCQSMSGLPPPQPNLRMSITLSITLLKRPTASNSLTALQATRNTEPRRKISVARTWKGQQQHKTVSKIIHGTKYAVSRTRLSCFLRYKAVAHPAARSHRLGVGVFCIQQMSTLHWMCVRDVVMFRTRNTWSACYPGDVLVIS